MLEVNLNNFKFKMEDTAKEQLVKNVVDWVFDLKEPVDCFSDCVYKDSYQILSAEEVRVLCKHMKLVLATECCHVFVLYGGGDKEFVTFLYANDVTNDTDSVAILINYGVEKVDTDSLRKAVMKAILEFKNSCHTL